MPTRVTGKQRASRIPLDYYKKLDQFARWKLLLSGVAGIAALAWLASGLSFGGPGLVKSSTAGKMRYSHGPVARVHATWDAKCEACHAPFSSISGETWPSAIGIKPSDADHRCSTCHAVADHAPNMIGGEEGSCASCHRDHRGRDASLVRVDDGQCTKCHSDLKSHMKQGAHSDGSLPLADKIEAFPGSHPEFQEIMAWAKKASEKPATPAIDQGPVRFNHALHMTAGLTDAKNGKAIFTLAQLSEADRARYATKAGQPLTEAVSLSCASCHHAASSALPGVSDYQPITYGNDCAACHPVGVPVAAVAPGVANAGTPVSTFPLPHGLQPSAVLTLLKNASIGESMADVEAKKGDAPVGRDFPGRNSKALQNLPPAEEVAARVTHAEKILFGPGKGTCTECHRYETPKGIVDRLTPGDDLSKVRIASLKTTDDASLGRGHQAMMTPVWLGRAKFDHSAHKGVSCTSCHAGAYANAESLTPPGKPSHISDDVLIPGKETCVKCHAPEGSDATGMATGGAGHACVECHRFHNGNHAANVRKTTGRSIKDFLLGDPDPAKDSASK